MNVRNKSRRMNFTFILPPFNNIYILLKRTQYYYLSLLNN